MHDSPRRGLAVGFFDGVHLGHRAILAGAGAVLTFRTHPLALLAPTRAPKMLMDADTRLAAIRGCGVGSVTALDFTPEFARLSPEDFAARHLAGRGPIRCGANWRFGADGAGDAAFLRRLGFEVEVVPAVEVGGETVSSTRIRAALSDGRLEAATAMLGRPWTFRGRVVAGKGEGRALGFPTVNLVPVEEPPLARGVYAVRLGGVPALANWGVAPTFGDRAWTSPVLEVHFPQGDVPAITEEATVVFERFLRPERRFPNLAALRRAIESDLASLAMTRVPGVSPHWEQPECSRISNASAVGKFPLPLATTCVV